MVRFKNRYITVEVDPVKIPKTKSWELKSGKLYKAIVNTLSTLHGDFGVASTAGGLSVRYCNKETKIGIIRCRHGPHKLIASIIPFIKQIDDDQVQLNTLYTGATLHQCYKFIKSYQLNHLRKFYSMLRDGEKYKYFAYEKSAMDLEVIQNFLHREQEQVEVQEQV